jgi:integral membrane sensor domain MASE1
MPPIASVLLLLGSAIALVALIALHVLPTGLNPLRDPVSQYGITKYRAGYWTAAGGAALAGLGGAITYAHLPGVAAVITVVLLAIFAAARALIGFFPMDAPGAPRTATGRLHNALAFAAFGPVTAAAFVGAGTLHDAGHAELSTWTTVFGAVMALGTIGMLVAARVPRARGVFGLAERLIYAGFLAWFVTLGLVRLG